MAAAIRCNERIGTIDRPDAWGERRTAPRITRMRRSARQEESLMSQSSVASSLARPVVWFDKTNSALTAYCVHSAHVEERVSQLTTE